MMTDGKREYLIKRVRSPSGLRVLAALAEAPVPVTARRVEQVAGVSQTTAWLMINRLTELEWVTSVKLPATISGPPPTAYRLTDAGRTGAGRAARHPDALAPEDTVRVLATHLPHLLPDPADVAEYLAETLAEDGYALVAYPAATGGAAGGEQ